MQPTRRLEVTNNSGSMHIFEGRYYKINRWLLMSLGLWPDKVKTKNFILRIIFIGILTLYSIPQLISIYVHHKNIDRLMFSIVGFIALSAMYLKMLGMILAEENMKSVYRSIANNWQRIDDYCEREMLHKYSERARNATIFYMALMLGPALIALPLPLVPKILDFIRPLENPRPNIHLSEGEYLIDRETYFLLTFFADYIGVMLIVLVTITVDTMYFVSLEHCCALYAIVRSRLLRLGPIIQKNSASDEDVDSYEWLRRTIQLHQDALTFTSLLNDSYCIMFMFILVVALFFIPFGSCAIIANLDNPLHMIPYVVFLGNAITHGFFLCCPGQRIIDHQLSLLDAAYCSEWYAAPLRTRKLLIIFMLRCLKPVKITAGNLSPMTFQVYCSILKTSASYITVASSFR